MNNKVIEYLFKKIQFHNQSVLRFNFRGVGKSEGQFDFGKGELDDLRHVMDHLIQNHDVLPDQIHLIGYSFGAFICAQVASQTPVGSLTLIAPAVGLYSFPQLRGDYPVHAFMPENDELVDPIQVKTYMDKIENPKCYVEVKDAGHYFIGSTTKLIDQILMNVNLDEDTP